MFSVEGGVKPGDMRYDEAVCRFLTKRLSVTAKIIKRSELQTPFSKGIVKRKRVSEEVFR